MPSTSLATYAIDFAKLAHDMQLYDDGADRLPGDTVSINEEYPPAPAPCCAARLIGASRGMPIFQHPHALPASLYPAPATEHHHACCGRDTIQRFGQDIFLRP